MIGGAKIVLGTLLLAASIQARALPGPAIDQLTTRQHAELRDLEASQKEKAALLRESVKADTDDFKRLQKEKKRVFNSTLKEEKRANDQNLRGLGKPDRDQKRRDYDAHRKEEWSDFKQQRIMESSEFNAQQRDRVDFLEKVQKEERRQLNEKQRLELANVKP